MRREPVRGVSMSGCRPRFANGYRKSCVLRVPEFKIRQQVYLRQIVKLPAKIACLLLSLILLLNGTGFAAMLDCDRACCPSSAPPLAAESSHMNCHGDGEMALSSDAALQLENQPPVPPPVNFIQCGSDIPSASLLTQKLDLRYHLIASAALEQTSPAQAKG